LVPNINNPLGSISDDQAKAEIVKACVAHGTVIVEDDLYGELAYSGYRPAPLRRFDLTGNTITCSSYSKTLAPGLRIGWVLGGRWAAALKCAKSFSTVATATLPQLAITGFLARHDFERHLRKLRRELADNAERLRDGIARYWPAASCACPPAGGLSLWVRLPPGVSGQAVFEAALTAGIGTLPGQLFSLNGEHQEHLRLSCGQVFSEAIENAVRNVGRIVQELAQRV
jgi:DNA-binding transcriptional MocR family regulator